MSPVCPYCNTEIEGPDPDRVDCPSCGESHHGECWSENGGCTVFGCASAPGDGPVVTVDQADIAAAPPPPPPPFPSGSFAPPPPPPPPPSAREAAPEMSFGGYNVAPPGPIPRGEYAAVPKERLTYILLGIFLGAFGAHNFYAGYHGRGAAQAAISVCTLFMGSFIAWIWAVVEVCVVSRDSRNISMV